MNPTPKELWGDFVALFFPNECFGCGESLVSGEEAICTRCMLELPQTDTHLEQESGLQKRLSFRIPVVRAMALFKFSKHGRVQHLLHALKYGNHPEIGAVLGRLYGHKMREINLFRDIDVIIPVPLHRSRRRKRGYNQSAAFAAGLSEILDVPFTDEALVRKKQTATQTAKTKLSRWQNMQGVFSVKQTSVVGGKRILLVDDVVTTGATLEACAEVLLAAGCSQLNIACIAAV